MKVNLDYFHDEYRMNILKRKKKPFRVARLAGLWVYGWVTFLLEVMTELYFCQHVAFHTSLRTWQQGYGFCWLLDFLKNSDPTLFYSFCIPNSVCLQAIISPMLWFCIQTYSVYGHWSALLLRQGEILK